MNNRSYCQNISTIFLCRQLFQFLNSSFCWSVFLWHFTPSCGAWAFGLLQVIFPRYIFIFFVLIFTTMAYRNSRWNSSVKKVFYLFYVSVLSIPRNAFFVTREAFVVLEFVFVTPVCYVANFLYSPLYTNRTRTNTHNW